MFRELRDPPEESVEPSEEVYEPGWRRLALVPPSQVRRGLVARALDQAPDPVFAGFLSQLDPAELDPDTRVDLVRAWGRMAAWVEAQQQRALASVIDATADAGVDGMLARHEIGVALRLSPATAYDKVERASELTGRLADTLAALERGDITGLQASALAETVHDLDDAVAAVVQRRVLARAADQTLAEMKRTMRSAVIAADPAGAADRAAEARGERAMSRSSLDDGMAELRAVMTATDSQLVWMELTSRAESRAKRLADAGRCVPGVDALRVDELVAAVIGRQDNAATGGQASGPDGAADATGTEVSPMGLVTGPAGRDGHSRVQLRVTVDLPTLLGLADHPAQLAGHGPVPPELARALASDADWVRWVTDPQTGELLDLGRRRYRPSRPLIRFIQAKFGVCEWPGCHRAAERCDLDHILEFDQGGETTRDNLGPRCRQHHNAKTHGGWRYHRDPDGTGHLTSPLGKSYDTEPPWRHPDG